MILSNASCGQNSGWMGWIYMRFFDVAKDILVGCTRGRKWKTKVTLIEAKRKKNSKDYSSSLSINYKKWIPEINASLLSMLRNGNWLTIHQFLLKFFFLLFLSMLSDFHLFFQAVLYFTFWNGQNLLYRPPDTIS